MSSSSTIVFEGYESLLDTINDLRAHYIVGLPAGSVVLVKGRLSYNDQLGSIFVWDPTSELVDNGTTIIANINSTVGRWLSIF